MLVNGIGNVREVNSSYIHVNNDGKQDRIVTKRDHLVAVYETAKENLNFYDRMTAEIKAEYEKRLDYADKHYHYISDKELEQIRLTQGFRAYLEKAIDKDTINRAYLEAFNKIDGLFEGYNYALERKEEAGKIFRQAETILKEF